ncbi:MAG: 50S ribosome-binding GTPase [Phycisphaerales bacterium]|nr:50S ribosome-binding GTPase [Phycisphaerales bacterium]
MLLSDAIAAVSTFADRPAAAAAALIRISAPDLSFVAAGLLRTSTNEPIDLDRRGAFSGRFILPPLCEPSLPVLIINLPANASFTGQATLELVVPGSPVLVSRVLRTILAQPNTRRAEPGEFAARAYALGRLTLAQAEGLAAFIAASTDAQLRSAKSVLTGSLGSHCLDWHARLSRLLALVEAGIDFTDQEDVRGIDTPQLIDDLQTLLRELHAHLGISPAKHRESISQASLAANAPPSVLLLGPPSAGKSTLFNALLGRARALTDEAPGTTRDLLREPLTLQAHAAPRNRSVTLTLTDAPGLDIAFSTAAASTNPTEPRTHAEILARAQARAIDAAREAALVIWCSSIDHPADVPAALASTINPRSIIRVQTKLDRAGFAINAAEHDRLAAEPRTIALCALTGHNLDHLRSAIFDSLWSRSHTGSTLDLLPRHHAALFACANALANLHEELTQNDAAEHPELIAHTLRTALDALAPLTGRVERDETLGLIFSTFCIGK